MLLNIYFRLCCPKEMLEESKMKEHYLNSEKLYKKFPGKEKDNSNR
jgi:hypothetical protein